MKGNTPVCSALQRLKHIYPQNADNKDSSHIFMSCLYFRLNSKDEFVELMSSYNGDNKHYLRSGTRRHTGRRASFK